MKVLSILRAERYSPNSVANDRAILEAVNSILRSRGHDVTLVSENDTPVAVPPVILSMSRHPSTLSWLKTLRDVRIINPPKGVENCSRSTLTAIMSRIGTPMPPEEGAYGYWLKRGDSAAQSADDVQFAASKSELAGKIRAFEARGITDYVISAHVVGDIVKFYGVLGTDFFRFFYPTDDGLTKFGDESHNGSARHYAFDEAKLRAAAESLALAVGIQVYGGDCIVRDDGSFCVIDFNDWPSFSRCREEAAEAIAGLLTI